MRVVLTVNFSPWSAYSGGGQRSTHHLAQALSALGHRVSVVYTKPPWERVPVEPVSYGVSWAALLSARSRSDALLRPLTPLSVLSVLRRLTADGERVVVHGNGEEAAAVGHLRGWRDMRFVMTPRYPAFPAAMADGGWRARPAVAARLALTQPKYVLLGRALATADRICPTSRSAALEVERIYGLSETEVVPNGLSQRFFDVRREPGAVDGPLIYFGRLAPEKGVDTLLEAAARLGDACPRIVMVGRGSYEEALRARARRLGLADRVEMAGWRDEAGLCALLAGARLAVLPSREESFGNAMAEAMAAGVPLLSTRAGSIPELVDDGCTGVLVPPGDPSALADALGAMLADTRRAESMAALARQVMRRRYSWEQSARRFTTVYESLWS